MTIGFAQTFPLDRSILSKALTGFLSEPRMAKEKQMSKLGIGSRAVEGYTRWLSIMGLRDSAKKELTPLGKLIARHDPQLEQNGTKWVLHYRLSSDPTPHGAEAWYHCVNHFLPTRAQFTRSELKRSLEEESGIRTGNRKGPAADLGLILTCYTSQQALGELEIIQLADGKTQLYRRGIPQSIPPLVIAYVLYDQRERLYPESTTVSIPEVLTAGGNIGKIFLMNRRQLEEALAWLQAEGYIRVLTFADLNHVEFLYRGNPLDLVVQFYDHYQRQ